MPRIILIDDEPNLRRTLARLLELEGHQVLTGGSFAEVEAHLHPGGFDVLVSDILMPEFDGVQILREVVDGRGCREPVVLITGQPSIESASEAVRHGAFDYIRKPVTKVKLIEVVARGLRHVELLRERDRARSKEMELLKNLAILGEEASLLTHEIRTPITSLRHALHAVADKLGIAERVVVEDLVKNIQRIERLLTHTLSFARPLELSTAALELADVARDAIAQVEAHPDRPAMQIDLRTGGPSALVDADPDLLAEVLVNLLRNACEACASKRARGERGTILLSVGGDSSHAWIDVRDDGPGVPATERDEIFRLFRSSKEGGTGIGLAFSRKIAESHRGTLELLDTPGPGACFRLKLPRYLPRPLIPDTRLKAP
jgi:signal transduction histidine kinase